MNYPGNINKTFHKVVNYANRGMDLEDLINTANDYYLDKNMAVIYKKPTPIQVTKYDYEKKRITDAYYNSPSTLDYNGLYKGYYIEFDAKNTNKNFLPLNNIAVHQIQHIERINNHRGIVFLLIMINNEAYVLNGIDVLNFIKTNQRKSIPYSYIKSKGINVKYNYLKGIDYLPAIDILIRRLCEKD